MSRLEPSMSGDLDVKTADRVKDPNEARPDLKTRLNSRQEASMNGDSDLKPIDLSKDPNEARSDTKLDLKTRRISPVAPRSSQNSHDYIRGRPPNLGSFRFNGAGTARESSVPRDNGHNIPKSWSSVSLSTTAMQEARAEPYRHHRQRNLSYSASSPLNPTSVSSTTPALGTEDQDPLAAYGSTISPLTSVVTSVSSPPHLLSLPPTPRRRTSQSPHQDLTASSQGSNFSSPSAQYLNFDPLTDNGPSLPARPDNSEHVWLVQGIQDLKNQFRRDVALKLDSTEVSLSQRLDSFESSLAEFKRLRDRSKELTEVFNTETNRSTADMSSTLDRIRNQRVSDDIIKGLEERIKTAKTKIENSKATLTQVRQWVELQETDDMQRSRRRKVAQRSTLLASFLVVLLVIAIHRFLKTSSTSAPETHASTSLDDILVCLSDFDSCRV